MVAAWLQLLARCSGVCDIQRQRWKQRRQQPLQNLGSLSSSSSDHIKHTSVHQSSQPCRLSPEGWLNVQLSSYMLTPWLPSQGGLPDALTLSIHDETLIRLGWPHSSRLEAQALLLLLRRQLDVGRQAQRLQQLYHHPRHVHLPPLQAVACGELKRVVVVVPALAKRQDADPPGMIKGVCVQVSMYSTPCASWQPFLDVDSRSQQSMPSAPWQRTRPSLPIVSPSLTYIHPCTSCRAPSHVGPWPQCAALHVRLALTSCCATGRPCCRSGCPTRATRC